MLTKAYQSVREFHKTFGHPAPDVPTTMPIERVAARANWITEEADETRDASLQAEPLEQLVGVADGYIDAIYFGLGGLVELGIDPDPLFEIVHAANMAKRHLINGELVVVTRADGKVVKPEGWVAPEPLLRAEVMRQIHAAQAA